MDEIADLQAELAAVQQQTTVLKLSDHNVIDVLRKLQQIGKIECIHTITGKEIMTPTHLMSEIQEQVVLHGGRIMLSELTQIINVDRSYIDKYVSQLAKIHRKATLQYFVINHGEEIVTNEYLDGIMEDTNTLLQENGKLTIGELAQQYGFAVEYMKEIVISRIGMILHSQLHGTTLHTTSFVETQRARIRGVFTAITKPTFIPDMVRLYQLDEQMVNDVVQELIQSKVLIGAIRGREYMPHVFIKAQRESVYSFFQQNGYINRARAMQLQVVRPYEFLSKQFPDAMALHDMVISRSLQLQVEGSIEMAIQEETYVDIRTIVPSGMDLDDMRLLLSQYVKKDIVHIGDVFAISQALLMTCLDAFKDDALVQAHKAQERQQVQRLMDVGCEQSQDLRRRISGKNGSSEEESKKKNRGKADTKSKVDKRKENAVENKSEFSITPSRQEAIKLLTNAIPALEDVDELVDSIVDHLEPEMETIYSSTLTAALSSLLRGDAAIFRDIQHQFEDQFETLYAQLCMLEKGYNKLSLYISAKDKDASEYLRMIEIYVLETQGIEIASLVTRFVATSNNLEMDGISPLNSSIEAERVCVTSLSDMNKNMLETHLSVSMTSAILELWTLATSGSRSLSEYLLHIPKVTSVLSMPMRKMDRKRERKVLSSYRQRTLEGIERGDEKPRLEMSALILQVVFQQCTGLPILLPPTDSQTLSLVLQALGSVLSQESVLLLQELINTATLMDDNAEWKLLIKRVQKHVITKDKRNK